MTVGRTIEAGYGALWAAAEEHEVRSTHGATAVCIEGQLDVWALAVTGDIEVREYDPQWPQWFEAVCDRVRSAVEDVAVRIDHVGSTSVPRLAAKPIIDIDIVVASAGDVPGVIERLAGIGYRRLLRDLLREDETARQRHGALKRVNAEAAGGDIDVYVAAKAELVAELLTRARAERGLPPVEYWQPPTG